MNKEATEQLQRLAFDWEENGLFTKLNQTDINAIGVIMSELELANDKLDKIKEYFETTFYDLDDNALEDQTIKHDILSIINEKE